MNKIEAFETVNGMRGDNIPFTIGIFPGGEVMVRLKRTSLRRKVSIEAKIVDSVGVMVLLMLTDALRRHGAKEIHLRIPYLPYARQDRVSLLGESHSLRVFCYLINSQHYESVEVWDVHSNVALALLDRVVNTTQNELLIDLLNRDRENLVLVSPDAGSISKTESLGREFKIETRRADKTRDPVTGNLSGAVVYTEHIGDKDFFIADDICDGGRTFLTLAALLRKYTKGKVKLYITHGIFSAGPELLSGEFDDVYVANLMNDDMAVPDNFHIYPNF